MRVLVTGASGAVGAHLVPRLTSRGHDVVATTRSRDKLERLRQLGAEPAVLDGLDASAVGETVARVAPDAIIHEMTALSGKPDLRRFDRWFAATNALRTQATMHLLAAAHATGVKRVLVQSYTGWNNPRTGGPVTTEDDGLDRTPLPDQRQTLEAIRAMESMVLDAPLEGIVLRYGNLYGPETAAATVELLRKRMLPIIGDGGGGLGQAHVNRRVPRVASSPRRPGAYSFTRLRSAAFTRSSRLADAPGPAVANRDASRASASE